MACWLWNPPEIRVWILLCWNRNWTQISHTEQMLSSCTKAILCHLCWKWPDITLGLDRNPRTPRESLGLQSPSSASAWNTAQVKQILVILISALWSLIQVPQSFSFSLHPHRGCSVLPHGLQTPCGDQDLPKIGAKTFGIGPTSGSKLKMPW